MILLPMIPLIHGRTSIVLRRSRLGPFVGIVQFRQVDCRELWEFIKKAGEICSDFRLTSRDIYGLTGGEVAWRDLDEAYLALHTGFRDEFTLTFEQIDDEFTWTLRVRTNGASKHYSGN